MRRLTAGLAIMALAITGCATATATSSGGKAPAAATSHSPATGTSGTATAGIRPGGSSGSGSSGLARWVVNGTFETEAGHVQPLSGVVTFRDSTGHTVNVTVGASGTFSLGLVAGTYTATGQTGHSDSPCSAPVTVNVRAGQLTRVALVCKVS